ncbi:MAG: DUF3349 domain-containing protein [Mycobacterium sp.]
MTNADSASTSYLQSVLDWLHKGYPDGVPAKDYYPLLALLSRSLSEDEVVQASRTVLMESRPDNPISDEQIRQAVHQVTAKEPNDNEINQVAARLALVGWPLSDHC